MVVHRLRYLLSVCAAALIFSVALSASAGAVDVPFSIDNGIQVIEGIGRLENGHLTGQASRGGKQIIIIGDIRGSDLTIEVQGSLIPPGSTGLAGATANYCTARGLARAAAGKVAIPMNATCGPMNKQVTLYLDLSSSGNSSVGSSAAPQPAPTAVPLAPVATLPPLDPIDETFVALGSAKVREKPDALSTRVKTIGAGENITVVGKLQGHDWYLVSENDEPIGYVIVNQLVRETQYHPTVAAAAPAATRPWSSATTTTPTVYRG